MKLITLIIAVFLSTSACAAVGYVETIKNNSSKTYRIRSIDDRNNGVVFDKHNKTQELHGGKWITIKPREAYSTQYFGIPWYVGNGKEVSKHFKDVTIDGKHILRIFQAQPSSQSKNWIYFVDILNGKSTSVKKLDVSVVGTSARYFCSITMNDNSVVFSLDSYEDGQEPVSGNQIITKFKHNNKITWPFR